MTITFGVGASIFDDPCAPRSRRPAGLVGLPDFPSDRLERLERQRHGTARHGTAKPTPDSGQPDELVWVKHVPAFMQGGTYMATRRIHMMLTVWDRMGLHVQEANIGRVRDSDAPLIGGDEFTPLEAEATGPKVQPIIGANVQERTAKSMGPGMLRRGYSFDNCPRAKDLFTVAPEAELDHDDHDEMDHSATMRARDDRNAGPFATPSHETL